MQLRLHATLGIGLAGAAALSAPTGQALLEQLISEPFLKLASMSDAEIGADAIDQCRRKLERDRKEEQGRLERDAKQLAEREGNARRDLEALNRGASRDTAAMSAERRTLHCSILKTEQDLNANRAQRKFGIEAHYQIYRTRLGIIERWPGERKRIAAAIAEGRGRDRRHGDVDDIGIRKLADGQDRDIALGMEGIREMRGHGLMPPETQDSAVRAYVQRLGDRIAANSDLHIPLKVTVLESDEINAFALPGGFVFVNTALLENADDESELAGVLAHEVAHAAARHGYRLTQGLSVRNLVTEGAQMAANIFTGGATGTATHYVRAYGFFGIGMALNLRLLGVDTENEAEANQLGVQYVWRTGYDPEGYLRFVDKMASNATFLRAISFFHTHPCYGNAVLTALREIDYLPKKPDAKTDSARFREMRKAVSDRVEKGRRLTGADPAGACEDQPERANAARGKFARAKARALD